jgi:hypothetical protein
MIANAQFRRKSIEWSGSQSICDVTAVGWAHVIESDNANPPERKADVR